MRSIAARCSTTAATSALLVLALSACTRPARTAPPPWSPRWADSAAVVGALLDTLVAKSRTEALVVRLRSCRHLPAPCAEYGGWSSDSMRARALLDARGIASAPPVGTAPGHPSYAIGAPLFRGADAAIIDVYFIRGSPSDPLRASAADFRVYLERRADGWHVVEWHTTRMT